MSTIAAQRDIETAYCRNTYTERRQGADKLQCCTTGRKRLAAGFCTFVVLAMTPSTQAASDSIGDDTTLQPDQVSTPDITTNAPEPDLRDEDTPVKFQRGDIVGVPIPTSDPTLGTGLIGVVGYYWAQTDEKADVQPPSLSGVGLMYTDSESWAVGLGHAGYWQQNTWRLRAAAGYAELNLPLLATDILGLPVEVDWLLKGGLAYAQLSRRVAGKWYVGLQGRYLDVKQDFSITLASLNFDLISRVEAASLGPRVEFDSRDTINAPRRGRLFTFSALATRGIGPSDLSYEAYEVEFRSFHQLTEPLVLAWRAKLCDRAGGAQLWDACRIGLRGFPATDYMGLSSAMAEVEARWQFSRRWGGVAFAGAGRVRDSFRIIDGDDGVPSFGVGVRLMVSENNRVNLRLDYGRTTDSDAIYLFVGEAF